MRYRSFGRSGQAISAVVLALEDDRMRPTEMVNLVLAGLENGINAYEARADNPPAMHAIGQAVSALDRKMVIIGLRVPAATSGGVRNLTRDAVIKMLQDALRQTGLRWIDYLVIEDPQPGEISSSFLLTIEAARQAKRLRYVGVSGAGETIDGLIEAGGVHLFAAPFNLRADWKTRSRLKAAAQAGMIVTGYDYHPLVVKRAGYNIEPDDVMPRRVGLMGFVGVRQRPVAVERTGPYAFLDHVRGWTADQVCLAYALNEPSLATVRIATADPAELAELAGTVEREMPNGLPAQIELARVSDLD